MATQRTLKQRSHQFCLLNLLVLRTLVLRRLHGRTLTEAAGFHSRDAIGSHQLGLGTRVDAGADRAERACNERR